MSIYRCNTCGNMIDSDFDMMSEAGDCPMCDESVINVVAYGGGTDSTAMLIECITRGIDIDLILFADTGGEKPYTYKYIDLFNDWLKDKNQPEIVTTSAQRDSRHGTLENYCLFHKQLPSVAYGFKTCSIQFKIEPIDEYLKAHYPDEWAEGNIVKLIGMDAGESHRARESGKSNYTNKFPLIEWDIDRDDCIEIIKSAGLPLPGKSACYFCPSSKAHEIRLLKNQYPDLAERAIKMEENAQLTHVKGLGRSYSWKNLLATDDMFDEEYNNIDIACDCYDG